MENYQTIQAEFDGPVVTLWLSRPKVHNALNEVMILEINRFFSGIEESTEIRAVIIRGREKSFCSGADLRWMKNAFILSPEENLKESEELSAMFRTIFESSKIVIAVVHGNVFGGGNGLVAVSDLAYSLHDARFSLSETRIGMAAVSITPYLLQKIAASDLKELIFSAKTFGGEEAVKYGLVNQSFSTQEAMDLHVNNLIDQVMANGTQALATSKQLINQLTMRQMADILEQAPGILAHIRVSPEAFEGFSAFLEKRKPNW
jgi:methylglutaconyl-CoA hydratase